MLHVTFVRNVSRVCLRVVLKKTVSPKAIDVAYYINGCQMICRTSIETDAVRVIEHEQVELRALAQKMLPNSLRQNRCISTIKYSVLTLLD